MHATVVLDEARRALVTHNEGISPAEDLCPVGSADAAAVRATDNAELRDAMVRVARSDAEAFAELYDRTSARVHGLVLRVLRDPGYAEETTQEVFLQAWNTASNFDPSRGSVMSWLMTLAHRRAVDRVRSEQAGTDRQALYESTSVSGPFDHVTEEVTRRLEHQSVLACLDTLTATQRESVAMAYYDGRTYREVAAHLGVALSTVKTRIRDGLTRLRGCLGGL
jgi:RNA polymerase sigma-70 factor (ECF subfamily)